MTTFSDGVYQFGGVPVSSAGNLPMFTGNAWFVSSVIGSDGNSGKKPSQPFATINAAVTAATASNDDVIYVVSGHAETISSATIIVLNKAGINIVGLGVGARRPTLTYTTATTANIPVTANNVTIRNILFVANFAAVASAITNNAGAEMQIIGCEFRDTDSTHNFVACVTNTVTVNSDGLTFNSNKVFGAGTTAATTPLKIAGSLSRLTVQDNMINLAVLNSTASLLAIGALVVTNADIARNKVFRPSTATAGGFLISGSSTTNTGMVYDNYCQHATASGALLTPTGLNFGYMNNLMDGDADASGYVLPAIGVN